MSAAARLLAALLADPGRVAQVRTEQWPMLLTIARAERLAGTLALRLDGLKLPASVQAALDAARTEAQHNRTTALWESEMARRALGDLGLPVILLKGTAYAAAGLTAGQGRQIGDLDILVPRDRLDTVEAALLKAGWEWVKPDAYDDLYYRRWMHELPPLIHTERDRMIDVHHTILPLTARPKPDAAALIAAAVPLRDGLFALSPTDMVIHAAAHLIADGELDGGMRNLWDIDRLVREFGVNDSHFFTILEVMAQRHGLSAATTRALRLAHALYATPLAAPFRARLSQTDRLFLARILARDCWGRGMNKPFRLGFYIRAHLIRMPLPLLLRHLWIKWRRMG
ncbi:MAG: nucleotidyltransferase family protein [Alphaproteobacteria bacterium]|nr:nucleotidyltransferase family protein [Alphaproteobacteria bacterium]MDE2041480.1 nucleotidyltransferase family protein [Alphaproteobacteria bacterium]MDE2341143.1 nucleotidyltransferase family protein [Alphaproteobacteria bacterium]